MKMFPRLLATACMLLVFCACASESGQFLDGKTGIAYDGDASLDNQSFTGSFDGTFTTFTEPYIMLESDLPDKKTVRLLGKCELSGSGFVGPVALTVTGEGGETLIDWGEEFGIGYLSSSGIDRTLTLAPGRHTLVLRGCAGLHLELRISDSAPDAQPAPEASAPASSSTSL